MSPALEAKVGGGRGKSKAEIRNRHFFNDDFLK